MNISYLRTVLREAMTTTTWPHIYILHYATSLLPNEYKWALTFLIHADFVLRPFYFTTASFNAPLPIYMSS